MALSACAPNKQGAAEFVAAQGDIHERLSDVITRDGFSHSLRSQRDDAEHYDAIYVSISLDSLKARHHSLDKLMTDIGKICAHPNYAHLPIRIAIGAGDEDDRMFLFAVLANVVKGRPNISVVTTADPHNDVTITVRHSVRVGS